MGQRALLTLPRISPDHISLVPNAHAAAFEVFESPTMLQRMVGKDGTVTCLIWASQHEEIGSAFKVVLEDPVIPREGHRDRRLYCLPEPG